MIDAISARARRDRYGNKINRTHSPVLAYAIPWLSIMLGSLLPQLVIASAMPMMPPLGYLLLLSWRLVRPGLLPIWAGFPLGMFDDLFSGQPFGSGILLWSLTMLGMELFEAKFPWRGFFQDWLVAGGIVTLYLMIAAVFSGAAIAGTTPLVLAPQIVISLVLIPLLSRLVAVLDRFRLTRIRVLG